MNKLMRKIGTVGLAGTIAFGGFMGTVIPANASTSAGVQVSSTASKVMVANSARANTVTALKNMSKGYKGQGCTKKGDSLGVSEFNSPVGLFYHKIGSNSFTVMTNKANLRSASKMKTYGANLCFFKLSERTYGNNVSAMNKALAKKFSSKGLTRPMRGTSKAHSKAVLCMAKARGVQSLYVSGSCSKSEIASAKKLLLLKKV